MGKIEKTPGHVGREAMIGLARLGYSIELGGQENLHFLKERPSTPIVFIGNHITLDDPVLLASSHFAALGTDRELLLPMSYYHSQRFDESFAGLVHDLARGVIDTQKIKLGQKIKPADSRLSEEELTTTLQALKKSSLVVLYSLFAKLGQKAAKLQMPRLIQAYTLRDETLSVEELEVLRGLSNQLALQFRTSSQQIFLSGGSLALFPEGHRSDGGNLQPAEDGLGLIVLQLENLKKNRKIFDGYVVPVATTYAGQFTRGVNFHPGSNKPRVKVNFGQPMSLDKISAKANDLQNTKPGMKPRTALTMVSMLALRNLLPESMWGVYHPNLLEDTMAGRYELRINPQSREPQVFDKFEDKFA